jgi:hypothetical protein
MCEIIDIQTGESIIREMNDEEYSQYLADQAAWEAQEAERLAKQAEVDAAKAAVHEKLAALGLDMETVKLIAKLG